MSWQIFPNVTLTNGSKNIAINDSESTAGILAGYAVNKDNKSYEIESITSSAIILVDAWSEATAANVKIKIQPTSEPIKEYIQETLGEVKGLVADYLARLQLEESIISSTGTVAFTDSAGVTHQIQGWGNLGSMASITAQTSVIDASAGRGLLVGAYGIGGTGAPLPSENADALLEGGLFRTTGTWEGSPVTGESGANQGYLFCHMWSANTSGYQRFTDLSSKFLTLERRKVNSIWTEWQPIYTASNLNIDEFSGNANEVVAIGYAKSSSEALFYLPVSSSVSSISVTAFFDAKTVSGTARAAALSPVLVGETSDKLACVLMLISGGIAGETLTLNCSSDGSKIKVNQ